ncbi:PstS family phosphate ABC transporter substrate-binding protein [Calidifontibacillus erzurumensis]|uniref:Phosphate-binding protein n=1 Tax=Calidifontibacillus erzurumensis TaxID=2741433 RepID=A0A8J8GAW8_9BACI|nr:PstS family phosphate ABC transporter substrate-binding protein [Calidifontibacillus erzurumensis]NSL50327.1 PstS family phosphate ABC transporter substrate-binding protein [Calidifontibacillus erzurumensis]
MKKWKQLLLTFFATVLVIFTAACGGQTNSDDNNDSTHQGSKTKETAELEGDVIIDGSGTVYPLMARISEEYMSTKEENVSVQVGRAGSSAGFKKFIPGELDFANASRPIKDEEIDKLQENGKDLNKNVFEIKLAYDGLTIVINKENTWATEMTKEEVVNMFTSGKIKAHDKLLWSDIRPEWPAEEITFFGPNENHGTYEFFFETILDEQPMVETINLQQEYSTLVDLVSKDKNAIAFFGYGYYANNTDKLQAVKIDFGNGPVEPSLETIGEDLPYAEFTRPVFTYLNVDYAKEKPQVLDFAKFVVETADDFAGVSGFAPMNQETLDGYLKWLNAIQ